MVQFDQVLNRKGTNCAKWDRQGGDGSILYSTPMYTHIRRLPQEARAAVTEVPMKENNLFYTMDFEALEQAVTPQTGVYVLCNPHNPVGRVFTRQELTQVADFAKKHELFVVADEIHCELVLEGEHIPYFSLNKEAEQNSITLCSAGKIANIPGLPLAYAIIPNPDLRKRFEEETLGLFPVRNILSETALTAAYNGSCDAWKEELRDYLRANRDYLEVRISEIPGLKAVHNQATYLVWIDTRETGITDPYAFFLEKARVHFNDGKTYGLDGFVRLNFGCPRSQLKETLDRVEQTLKQK